MKRVIVAILLTAGVCLAVPIAAQETGPTLEELHARVTAIEEHLGLTTTTVAPTTTTTEPPAEPEPTGRDAIIAGAGLSNPDAVPAKPSDGITVSEAGAVVENVHVSSIKVEAPNVILRNVRVTYNGSLYGVRSTVADGLRIENSVIDCKGASACVYATRPHTVRNSRVTVFEGDAVKASHGPDYEGNYIEATKPAGSTHHTDGVQVRSGSNLRFVGNVIEAPASAGGNAALILQAADGAINGILVDSNWLNGGNYTVYVTQKGSHPCPTDARVTNNHFGPDYRYGTHRLCPGVEFSGNTGAS